MHSGMTLTRIQGQGRGHRDTNALAEVDHQSPYGANFFAPKTAILGPVFDMT